MTKFEAKAIVSVRAGSPASCFSVPCWTPKEKALGIVHCIYWLRLAMKYENAKWLWVWVQHEAKIQSKRSGEQKLLHLLKNILCICTFLSQFLISPTPCLCYLSTIHLKRSQKRAKVAIRGVNPLSPEAARWILDPARTMCTFQYFSHF